ncbi:hypothetical protein C8R43DRAFT_1002198 [Mycena crocata]|nr:hypothetical protein C8R43DRAFT_1002198 [Mycena crocata]
MVTPSPADPEFRPVVDLQREGVRLCIALQSELNSAFLGAANDLLSCTKLPPADFRRHSRKIVRLIETARDTLEASGVSLYMFTSCQKGKWKDLYFDLLRMLQARRCDVDVALQARTNYLVVRLSSNFVGRGSCASSQMLPSRISLPENSRQALAQGITTCISQPSSTCNTMPPPDAFPPAASQFSRHRKRRVQATLPEMPFWEVSEVAHPQRKRRRHTERENQSPAPDAPPDTYAYKSPPLTKRFGIFCTGKSSMHRPRSVRAY